MMEHLKSKERVVGINQTKKAIAERQASIVYLASDADKKVVSPLETLALAAELPVVFVDTMKELGEACGIDVGAAAAAVIGQPE